MARVNLYVATSHIISSSLYDQLSTSYDIKLEHADISQQ